MPQWIRSSRALLRGREAIQAHLAALFAGVPSESESEGVASEETVSSCHESKNGRNAVPSRLLHALGMLISTVEYLPAGTRTQ